MIEYGHQNHLSLSFLNDPRLFKQDNESGVKSRQNGEK